MDERNGELEIDLLQMLGAVWRRIWLVILSTVLLGAAAFGGTYFLIAPSYEANALFYVNNSTLSLGSAGMSISTGEISAAKTLVDTYITILGTRGTLNEVIEMSGVRYDVAQLNDMIEAKAVNNTEIFQVKVTSNSPREAELIANTIAEVLPNRIADIVSGSSVRIVDYAVIPSVRSGPSYSRNTAIGALLGILLSVGAIVLMEILDTSIRSEQNLLQLYSDIPILASIPDMRQTSTGRYGSEYGYGEKSREEKK